MRKSLTKQASKFLENRKDRKLIFTNGCFDILHRGHLTYLASARQKGDLLFVGLNSDVSVRRLKGPGRPINSELDRKFFLESLKFVDFVEVFDEETPLELIKLVKPDVLVKGGDWSKEQIVGSSFVLSYGGEVESLTFVQGHSTTKLIQDLQGKQ
tara:strand:+ start:708 stop:1172 length:465 start_codon:yes stop_codon:yes gene_type:complete